MMYIIDGLHLPQGWKVAPKTVEAKAGPGFETTLWAAVDTLRGNIGPSEHRHVALGLIVLQRMSAT